MNHSYDPNFLKKLYVSETKSKIFFSSNAELNLDKNDLTVFDNIDLLTCNEKKIIEELIHWDSICSKFHPFVRKLFLEKYPNLLSLCETNIGHCISFKGQT